MNFRRTWGSAQGVRAWTNLLVSDYISSFK